MAQTFPSWSDTLLRCLVATTLLGMVGVPGLLSAWWRSPLHTGVDREPDQPIEFDHRHHVVDVGISCLYCHYDAARAPTAGVPETRVCMGCHAQIHVDSPLLEPVLRSWFENEPIRWNRVSTLPDFVYFDHSVHVSVGVGCESCHGRVDRMARVRQVFSLQMRWCLDCHREPKEHLRPLDEITTMGWNAPPGLGQRLAEERHVEPPVHCSGCHR